MKNMIYVLGLSAILVMAPLSGCAEKETNGSNADAASQKPVISFEGVVTTVEDDSITLDNGKVIMITDQTEFTSDPDSGNTISSEISIGNYIQGYTEDNTDLDVITANKIWTNTAPVGEKIAMNFEGRVSAVENEKVVLENGKIIIITSETVITTPDGSFSEVAAGDYIQGYAEDPTGNEILANYVLITTL